MKYEIVIRKSHCDKDTYFYDLFLNDIWVCGFYSLVSVFQRLKIVLGKINL